MKHILKERLLKILSNPEQVEDLLVETIANEALEIVDGRDLSQPFILDIAIYRYLLIKGDLITEAYETSYKDAMRTLAKAAKKIDENSAAKSSDYGISVGSRSAAWI